MFYCYMAFRHCCHNDEDNYCIDVEVIKVDRLIFTCESWTLCLSKRTAAYTFYHAVMWNVHCTLLRIVSCRCSGVLKTKNILPCFCSTLRAGNVDLVQFVISSFCGNCAVFHLFHLFASLHEAVLTAFIFRMDRVFNLEEYFVV